MSDRYRVQRPFELALPELQKIQENREFRGEIIILPDIALEEVLMIRHPIEDGGRGQPVTFKLTDELPLKP